MRITVWNLVNEKGIIYHNHIENDWVEDEYPKPLKDEYINQKAWKKMKWVRKYAYLVDDVVVCKEIIRN